MTKEKMSEHNNSGGYSENIDDLLDEAIRIAASFDYTESGAYNGLPLSDELTNLLYQEWYIHPDIDKEIGSLPHASWAEVFRAVHPGTYQWEPGWITRSVSSAGRVMTSRGREQRMLYAGDYINLSRPGLPPIPGSKIEAVARRDSTDLMEGYWVSYSSTWENAKYPMLRLYWNVAPDGAVRLAELIPAQFADKIPYSFKLPLDRGGYQRTDAAVLYFETAKFEQMKPALKRIFSQMKSFLYPDIPALTKRLERGLALAEEPPHMTESFGQNRCRLVAEAYLASGKLLESGMAGYEVSTQREGIKDYLLKTGMNLNRPYLNPEGLNEYKW